ncbi:hypothetical protein [Pseudomonas sp.]|uniref:hypothetical protein n=1 Tax=Pseudomonas sp. TaxID=306 RepID=UPI002C4000C4|nr:hypothetical protein [Pseudomonas sp.]HUE93628.1 hypothetical protein [Pseudomonas sp.]
MANTITCAGFQGIASAVCSDLERKYIPEHMTVPTKNNPKAETCDITVASTLSVTAKKIEIIFITEFRPWL